MNAATLALRGTIWLSKDAEREGRTFEVEILRPANSQQGILLHPERWERWNIKARTVEESEKTIRYHFHGVKAIRWLDGETAAA